MNTVAVRELDTAEIDQVSGGFGSAGGRQQRLAEIRRLRRVLESNRERGFLSRSQRQAVRQSIRDLRARV